MSGLFTTKMLNFFFLMKGLFSTKMLPDQDMPSKWSLLALLAKLATLKLSISRQGYSFTFERFDAKCLGRKIEGKRHRPSTICCDIPEELRL